MEVLVAPPDCTIPGYDALSAGENGSVEEVIGVAPAWYTIVLCTLA